MNIKYEDVNGIKVIHSDVTESHEDYNVKGLTSLYNSENKHFWFLHRKQFIYQELSRLIPIDKRIIEVGAGTGSVARYLIEKGYRNFAIGELHFQGLRYAQSYGIKDCYQFDLLRSPFDQDFDAVCMFDVLEHLEDPFLALKNVYQMLEVNGYVILTLPAHQWLWSREDKVAGHKKRYTKNMIKNELEGSGFEVITNTYFFKFITPLLFLRRVINPDNELSISENEYKNEIKINGFINFILSVLCRVENRISSILPNLFGGSLFVIGRKK